MNIDKFRNKKIHIVGITGVEGSAVLEFLLKHGITDITGHDFIKSEEIEKSFKIWHKGIGKIQRNKEFQSFKEDVNKIKYYFKKDYLKDINSADIIFVSQNWYSYSQNRILHDLKSKTPFYSMTRLYLELSPAITVGVTGTVGKGSVSHLLIQILEKAGKKVYFGGNDTWSDQVLDKLDEMKSDDILILEISHRQLLADFSKSPHIAVITNIFPNHLDEMPFADYVKAKFRILSKQTENDVTILNFDNPHTKEFGQNANSKVLYFSIKNLHVNSPIINYDQIIRAVKKPGDHNKENALAAALAARTLGVSEVNIIKGIQVFMGIKARLEKIAEIDGVSYYYDLKSTTPWATMAAVSSFTDKSILIMGGYSKKLDYLPLVEVLKTKVKLLILLKSEVADQLKRSVSGVEIFETDNLRTALEKAKEISASGDRVILSPGGAFFYTMFIDKKESYRKIITSLLPKESRSAD